MGERHSGTIEVGAVGNLYPPVDKLTANAAKAEERGYSSIFWPDHLMAWHPESLWTTDVTPMAEIVPTPHVNVDVIAAMTAAAMVTDRIGLGPAVTEIVRRHPAVLAQEMLTVHHFSAGRAILGIGAGEGENILPYGIDFSKPAGRLEEALRVIRLLWESDGPVAYEGDHFRLDRAVLGLGPYEGTLPPIWVAAHGPRMCRITGELGDGWMPTSMPLDEYAEKWALVRAAASKSGRDPDAITASMFTYTVPAVDHELAHDLMKNRLIKGFCLALPASAFEAVGAEHPLGEGTYGLTDYIPAGMSRDDAERAVDAVPDEVVHTYVWHGTADELEEQARRFGAVGMRHVLPWNVAYFGDLGVISSSYKILDELVVRLSRPA